MNLCKLGPTITLALALFNAWRLLPSFRLGGRGRGRGRGDAEPVLGSSELLLLEQESLGDHITEEVHELHRVVGRDRVLYLPVALPRHAGVHERHHGDLQLRGLLDDRRLPLGVHDHEAVGRLRGAEADLLVAGAELLGAAAVGEEPARPPQRVAAGGVAPDPPRHLLHDLVEQRVGVDEHEAAALARQGGDEVAGVAEADEGAVGVDDGHAVAGAVGEELEVVGGCDAAAEVGVRAQELLDDDGVERHPRRLWIGSEFLLEVSGNFWLGNVRWNPWRLVVRRRGGD